MAKNRAKPYECTVVSEVVQIYLRKRQRGMNGSNDLMVQCDQEDCQYVDRNEPPCQLSLDMFADEISEREEQARRRKEDRDYY